MSFNPCVTLGNNKLFYKLSGGVPCLCGTVRAGESTTHWFPREPGTSLTFTCVKLNAPLKPEWGGGGGWGGAGFSNDWCISN